MAPKYNLALLAGQLVVGGAERQLYLWLSHMDRKKFDPIVLTLHPGYGDYWEERIKSLGIPVIKIPHRRMRLLRAFEIIIALRPYKPQLIHGWHSFASPYAGFAAKFLRARSLGGGRDSYRVFTKFPLIANLTLLLVDALLVNSYSTFQQFQTKTKNRKKTIYVVQNAIEDFSNNRVEVRKMLCQRFQLSPDGIWIGSLGRLDPKKRFDLLLQAVKLLRENTDKFYLFLIGDGDEREELEKMTDELNLRNHVVFTGEIPDAHVWLSALDIFCFTSLDEGIPNAVMEAAVVGLPIVGWRVDFMEELLNNGDAAWLVEPEDLLGLKNALATLIHSPQLRNHYGQAAHRYILGTFSVDRFIRKMTSVYEELLAIQR